jgi:DNA polymerase-3 subunit delta'
MLFSEVLVGQRLKEVLINTVQNERVSHAQLFLGQEGTHALGLAVAYAQYVACKQRTPVDSCGGCSSCVKFANLAHPDLHFLFPHPTRKDQTSLAFYAQWRDLALNTHLLFSFQELRQVTEAGNSQPIINIHDAKMFLEKISLKPYESEYKFVIIFLPEKMNVEAANKLLKTLEEPDGKTLIILVSEDYNNILPTILSRTQLLKINKLPAVQFAEVVSQRLGCSMEKGLDLAALTDRNLYEALSKEIESVQTEHFKKFKFMMQAAYRLLYFTVPEKVVFPEIAEWLRKIATMGREPQKWFLRYALSMIRKCMLLSSHASELVHPTAEETAWMTNFAPFVNHRNAGLMEKAINDAIIHIGYNADPNILFTDLLIRLGKALKKGDKRLDSNT